MTLFPDSVDIWAPLGTIVIVIASYSILLALIGLMAAHEGNRRPVEHTIKPKYKMNFLFLLLSLTFLFVGVSFQKTSQHQDNVNIKLIAHFITTTEEEIKYKFGAYSNDIDDLTLYNPVLKNYIEKANATITFKTAHTVKMLRININVGDLDKTLIFEGPIE